MHIKLINGQPQPYSLGQLRRDNPQVSFPATIPADTLAEYGVFAVLPADRPTVDHTQRVTEGAPEYVNGSWQQAWTVDDLSEAELAEVIAEKWAKVRKQRNAMLAASDWTQLADAPADALSWAVYRQALRDITEQDDPFNIAWPAQPA
jgi:hypothetical protein